MPQVVFEERLKLTGATCNAERVHHITGVANI